MAGYFTKYSDDYYKFKVGIQRRLNQNRVI